MTDAPDRRPDIPEGFKPRRFGDGFIAVNGPLYVKKLDARHRCSAFASSRGTATRWASATAA